MRSGLRPDGLSFGIESEALREQFVAANDRDPSRRPSTVVERRTLTLEIDWAVAARLKRDRAYADIQRDQRWKKEAIHARYEAAFGAGEANFHLSRLRSDAGQNEGADPDERGELWGWFADGALCAYAAWHPSHLMGKGGPRLLIVGDLLVLGDAPDSLRRQIADELAVLSRDGGYEGAQATPHAREWPFFESAGFRLHAAVARFDP